MNFAASVKDFHCSCICQRRAPELSVVLKRVCLLSLSAISLCFPKRTFTPLLLLRISSLPCLWRLTSLSCSRLPLLSWSLPLCCSPFPFFFSAPFKAASPPTPVNRLLKNVLFFSFSFLFFPLQAPHMLMKWRLIIIIGLFWEDSLNPSSSLALPLSPLLSLFCVRSRCHSCESLLQLLWACMSVFVTDWVRVYVRMTKTYKTLCNELFKRLLPFERWVCVCFGWVCQVCASVGALLSVCVCVCVCTVCFKLALDKLLSQMLEAGKGTLNWSAVNWRLSRGFHKDRSQQVLLSYLALSHSSFMQLSLFWFLAALIESDKPIHGSAQ